MRSSIGGNHLDDLVRRHPDPSAVLLHLVVIVAGADFGRAAVRKIAAGRLGVRPPSFEKFGAIYRGRCRADLPAPRWDGK